MLDIRHLTDRKVETLFNQLIKRLHRFFNINKATLTFYDGTVKRLRVTHIYENGLSRRGATLNFPIDNSLMYQVLTRGFPVADNYPEQITGNLIEKKILLSKNARSVLIIPLQLGQTKLGLLSLASSEEAAFGLYLEGVGEEVVGELTAGLHTALASADLAPIAG